MLSHLSTRSTRLRLGSTQFIKGGKRATRTLRNTKHKVLYARKTQYTSPEKTQ